MPNKTRKPERPKSNSAKRRIEAFENARMTILPPGSVTWESKEEEERWAAYTMKRAPEDWSRYDLEKIARLIKIETMLEKAEKQLNEEGFVVQAAHGPKAHPIISVISTYANQMLSIGRHLGLHDTVSEKPVVENNSKAHKEVLATLAALDQQDPDGLIARSN